jgi:predicted nuclease with TOPRIM domain
MVVGFAAYRAINPNFLSLFMCLYVGGYEGYFMISGTFHDEKVVKQSQLETNSEVVFLKEKLERVRNEYWELQERYDHEGSDVYKNPWFKKKYLDPSWDRVEQAQKEYAAQKISPTTPLETQVTWLKVLYRLGIVFLCMILVHSAVGMALSRDHKRSQ